MSNPICRKQALLLVDIKRHLLIPDGMRMIESIHSHVNLFVQIVLIERQPTKCLFDPSQLDEDSAFLHRNGSE